MKTTHVPASLWRRTLDALSRRCDGSLISLEIVGGSVGAEEAVHEQPFRGITSDATGMIVQITKRGGIHLDHRVAHPRGVRIVETDDGVLVAVEIESETGTHSLVHFRSPPAPPRTRSGPGEVR
jgi:hypothetical protein